MSVALVALRVVLALACVLALVWFAGRKLSGTPGMRKARSIPLTVLGRQSLGKGSGIALVEVAGRVLLLGVGDQGVRVLTEIDVPAPVLEPSLPDGVRVVVAASGTSASGTSVTGTSVTGTSASDYKPDSIAPDSTTRLPAYVRPGGVAVEDVSMLVPDGATYVLREEIDLAALLCAYPDGSGRLAAHEAARTEAARTDASHPLPGVEPEVPVDPVALAHLAGLAASSSHRGANALQGSILSPDTWRRAVDAIQQRTVRR